jgi:hypothetical protein
MTKNTPELIGAALNGLDRIYREILCYEAKLIRATHLSKFNVL